MTSLVVLVVGVLMGVPVGVVVGRNAVIKHLRYDADPKLSADALREVDRALNSFVRD